MPQPHRCTRKCDDASSGTTPILTKRADSFASGWATRKSIGRTIDRPTPIAAPLIAPTIGFDDRMSSTQSTGRSFGAACSVPSSASAICCANTSEMSAPAQKPRPAPVMTNAPTAGSSFPAMIARSSSERIVCVHAFSLSGRLSVTSRIASRSSTMICWYSTTPPRFHAESRSGQPAPTEPERIRRSRTPGRPRRRDSTRRRRAPTGYRRSHAAVRRRRSRSGPPGYRSPAPSRSPVRRSR